MPREKKLKQQTAILPVKPLLQGLFPSMVVRSRYLLRGPDGYFTEENGAIVTTTQAEKAIAFVDVLAAVARAQALISVGFDVQSVESICSVF